MSKSQRLLPLACLLTACAGAQTSPPATTAAAPTTAPAPAAERGGPGPIDLGAMDRSVRPGDDFFSYANGSWFRSTEIPADRVAWGVASELDERVRGQTRQLLEAADSSS